MLDTLIVIAIYVLIAGLALLRAGLRGRVVPGVVECSGCRFDLTGLIPAARCPECGRDLAPQGASRQRRVRSRRRIAAGSALVGLPLVAGATIAVLAASNVNPWPHLPNWALRHVLLNSNSGHALYASNELVGRIGTGALSAAEGRSLADALSKRLGEPGVSSWWSGAHSDYFSAALSSGWVGDEDYLHFLDATLDVDLEIPERIRTGAEFGARLRIGAPKLVSVTGLPRMTTRVMLQARPVRVAIGSQELRKTTTSPEPPLAIVTGFSYNYWWVTYHMSHPPRTAAIALDYEIDVVSHERDQGVLGTLTRRFVREVTIVPADQPVIEINRDPALHARLQDAMSIRECVVGPSDGTSGPLLSLRLLTRNPPADAAFQVLVRPAGSTSPADERSIGTMCFRAGETSSCVIGKQIDGFSATSVDIIFRPSIEVAEKSPTLTSVWIGPDIIIENVEAE